MSPSNRIEFIDLAKGICILLVVIGHCGVSIKLPGLEVVRMPLYFVLSGLFYKDYNGIKNLIIKKSNKILVPFFFFYILGYIVFYLIKYISPSMLISDARGLFDLFNNRQFFNGPIWFLLALFWCNIYYYYLDFFLSRLNIESKYTKLATVIIIGTIGNLMGDFGIFIPLFMDAALTAFPFFYLGIVMKNTNILSKNKFDRYISLWILILYSVSLFISKNFSYRLSLHYNEIDGLATYLLAVSSVFTILLLCKLVGKLPLISFLGRYSIVLLCLHHMYYRPIKIILSKQPYEWINNSLWIAVFTILLCWLSIPICKKVIPWFIAQKDLIE